MDTGVLSLCRGYRRSVFGLTITGEDRDEVDDPNKSWRHAAYRQYILWQHGSLGKHDRRVIPSCCVWEIREKFPNPHGQYVGFLANRLH